MPKNMIDLLIKISEEKIIHLMRIHNYTKKQSELIKNGDIESLQDYISRKQKEIDHIVELDKRFHENFAELKKTLGVESLDKIDATQYSNIKKMKSVVEKITELLSSIADLEAHNSIAINKNYEEIKSKLKHVKKGKQVTKGYNSYKKVQGSAFFNKRK